MEFQGGSGDVEKEELVKESEELPERKGQKITKFKTPGKNNEGK